MDIVTHRPAGMFRGLVVNGVFAFNQGFWGLNA